MERRVDWLTDVVNEVGLDNVTIHRAPWSSACGRRDGSCSCRHGQAGPLGTSPRVGWRSSRRAQG
jgi:hypothetical protein